jgi:hypothetical protein
MSFMNHSFCELLNEKSRQPLTVIQEIPSMDSFLAKNQQVGEDFSDQYEKLVYKIQNQNAEIEKQNARIQLANSIYSQRCTGNSNTKHGSRNYQNDPVDQFKDQHE